MYKLLSFDVYGTLINTPPINAKAFRLILEQVGASNIDPLAFYQFWESRNIPTCQPFECRQHRTIPGNAAIP